MAESPALKVANWSLNLLRSLVTLILIGLLVLWLIPALIKQPMEKLGAKFWPSLGWGAVACRGVLLCDPVASCSSRSCSAILFSVLTLGGLSGTVIWLGILALFALIVGFVLVTEFLAKLIFGMMIGKSGLTKLKSPLADNKFWPMVIGVLITVLVIGLLSFPLIPTVLGGLLNLFVVLFGLGATWLWGREALAKKPAVPTA